VLERLTQALFQRMPPLPLPLPLSLTMMSDRRRIESLMSFSGPSGVEQFVDIHREFLFTAKMTFPGTSLYDPR